MEKKLANIFKKFFKLQNLNQIKKISLDKYNKWDSIAHINLILLVEEKFDIRFTENQILKIKKFSDFIKILKKN